MLRTQTNDLGIIVDVDKLKASFFDNNNGFVQVASYCNGELIMVGDYHPDWLVEFAELYRNGRWDE